MTLTTTTTASTAASTSPARRLVVELDELHARYAYAVNMALDSGDEASAEELVRDYDEDALRLVAEREGKTHLLADLRRPQPDSSLRRMLTRLRGNRAA